MQENASRKPGKLWSGPELAPPISSAQPTAYPSTIRDGLHPKTLPSPLPDPSTTQETRMPCNGGKAPSQSKEGSTEWNPRWNTWPLPHSLSQDTHVVKNQQKQPISHILIRAAQTVTDQVTDSEWHLPWNSRNTAQVLFFFTSSIKAVFSVFTWYIHRGHSPLAWISSFSTTGLSCSHVSASRGVGHYFSQASKSGLQNAVAPSPRSQAGC